MSTFIELHRLSPLVVATGYYYKTFGAITIAGGIVGFVKAKSRASLVAGSISGLLLILAGWMVGQEMRPGLLLGLFVSAVLGARFGTAFKKSRAVMPAGLIFLLSIVGVVLSVVVLSSWRS